MTKSDQWLVILGNVVDIFLMVLGLHFFHMGLERVFGTTGNASAGWSLLAVIGFLIARSGYRAFAARGWG